MRSLRSLVGVLALLAAVAVGADARGPAGFGVGGLVRTDFGGNDIAVSVAVQRDGRLVVAGRSSSADGRRCDVALARYTRAGLLDGSFGAGGRVLPASPLPRLPNAADAVALQADGKILVAGMARGKPALIRYRSDGRLDQSFGHAGKAVTPNSGALAVQRDGKVVIAGLGFAVTRVTPTGKLDRTFGVDGSAEEVFAPDREGGWTAVAIQADGKIVTAGYEGFAIARFNPDGSLDHSFGDDNGLGEMSGWAITRFGPLSAAAAIALQRDGKIVVAGSKKSPDRFALVRYTERGQLDPSFGKGGKVFTSFPGSDSSATVNAMAMQPNGRLVVAGSSAPGGDQLTRAALARYTSRGQLDTSFGTGGKVLTSLGATRETATISSIAIQADGRIVAAAQRWGEPGAKADSDFFVLRYTERGRLDR